MKPILAFLLILTLASTAYPQSGNLSFDKGQSRLKKLESTSEIEATKKKDFSFSINPYLWFVGMGGNVGLPNTPSGYPQTYDFNKSVSDVLSDLHFGVMVAGRLKYKDVSLLYDILYANLKDFGVTLPNTQQLTSGNYTIKEFVTDLAVAYRFSTSKSTTLDAYAGTRIWSMESELTLVPPNQPQIMLSASKTWVDPIIGIQANFLLSKQWFGVVKSDFGGFGTNSDWSFMILGGFGYMFNPNWNTSLGIKYLGVDYDKDGYSAQLNQYGLYVSFGYLY